MIDLLLCLLIFFPNSVHKLAKRLMGITQKRLNASASYLFIKILWDSGYDFACGTTSNGIAVPELLTKWLKI
jgi:hypothetical protein